MQQIEGYKQYNEQSLSDLIEKHSVLVKKIAHHLVGKLPSNILVDDMIQAGMLGLLDAVKNFDGSKGASFETYASIRIRGSMLDDVRRGDWTPRSVYRNSRLISGAMKTVEQRTGRDARDVEVAQQLEMSLDDYHLLLKDTSAGRLFGFDDVGLSDDSLQPNSTITEHGPADGVEAQDFRQEIAEKIATLPERESLVLSLYYQEELNLREIGEVLDVSESRVCQIHSQAMVRLKSRLAHWQN